jgi:hypothetical protein
MATNEHTIQSRFFAIVRRVYPDLMAFAVPNGFLRTESMRIRAWREGCLSGTPDVFVPMPSKGSKGSKGAHGLFLEFKTPRGKVSPAQQTFLNTVESRGYQVAVVRSLKEALSVLKEYLENRDES